jgi:hypothetical protein
LQECKYYLHSWVFRVWPPMRWRVYAAFPQTSECTQEWPYKKAISSYEPALWTVWPQSRGFEQKLKLNRTVCGVIFNVRIRKDFGLKNSVFYIRTVLTESNRFLCIFFFHSIYSQRIFYYCHKVKHRLNNSFPCFINFKARGATESFKVHILWKPSVWPI